MATRLDQLLQMTPIQRTYYQRDVAQLKREILELASVSDTDVERIYRDYCEQFYASSWLTLESEGIASFGSYLRQEVVV